MRYAGACIFKMQPKADMDMGRHDRKEKNVKGHEQEAEEKKTSRTGLI